MAQSDLIQQHVQQYLASNPAARHLVERVGDGEYAIDGRPVKVGFCRQGFLVVHDGPLRQPFTDYVEKKEATAIYHNEGLKNSSLTSVPKETRISFGDEGNRYSRLDAMKVAKEQAIFREKAATYSAEGQSVPLDLREKYEKNIDIKLGTRRMRETQAPKAVAVAPTWWPGLVGTPGAMPATSAPLTARPQYVPTVPSPKASLFGQVPDLLQIAQVRGKPQMATVPAPGTLTTAMPFYAAASAKAPAAGYHQRPIIAGPLCGA